MVKAYLAFMDHSITEQLVDDPLAWHTSAIALAEGGEVSELAQRIAEGIFPQSPRLRKWSDGRGDGKRRYRLAFARELARHLPSSNVYLFATSATEATITQNRQHVSHELGIGHMYHEAPGPRRTPLLRVGPFTHRETGAEHYFTLPLNRALMVAWIAHFVARMHRLFHLQLQQTHATPVSVGWFFYLDKFAGDSPDASPGISFFQTLVSGNIANGNIRSGFFAQSDTVDADLFADNLAGLLNASRRAPSDFLALTSLFSSGRIQYETSGKAA